MVELLLAAILADNGVPSVVHVLTDGRDTPPKSAGEDLKRLEAALPSPVSVATVIGRYYAMDRDRRWQRVKSAYDLLTQGRAEFWAENPLAGLAAAYARGESDEFVKATAILPPDGKPVKMEDGDSVIFLNFRSDRARQLSRPFIEPDFGEFEREVTPRLATYCTLTGYSDDFDVSVAFPPERIKNGLGEYVAKLGLRQLRIAETEKYPHVTFFFNGGEERVFDGEERILVASPKVATYDLKPEMSAPEVTDKLVEAIGSGKFDLIVVNYANSDMVGHTGNLDAAIKAIEAVDACLGRLMDAVKKAGGALFVTADHGNAEQMFDEKSHQKHTQHTSNRVPALLFGAPASVRSLSDGKLADVAPTML